MNTKLKTFSSLTVVIAATVAFSGCAAEADIAAKTAEAVNSATAEGKKLLDKATGKLTADNFIDKVTKAQFAAGSVHVSSTMNVDGGKLVYEGTTKFSEDPTKIAAHIKTNTEDFVSEMIMIGTDIYMKMSFTDEDLNFGGDKYSKIAFDPSDDEMRVIVDPSAQLAAMKENMSGFKAEPGEKIDGVKTTKYSFSTASDAIPGISGEKYRINIFVGPDNLPRRISTDEDAGPAFVLNYDSWGKKVDIQAPPADQIN